jgi:hypothetical protein
LKTYGVDVRAMYKRSTIPSCLFTADAGKGKGTPNRLDSLEGDRGIALYSLDIGARMGGWSAPRPDRFTPGKDTVPIV